MDRDYPQHEPPPAGSLLHSPPPPQSAMLHCPYWNTFLLPPYPAFSSESRQFMNSPPSSAASPAQTPAMPLRPLPPACHQRPATLLRTLPVLRTSPTSPSSPSPWTPCRTSRTRPSSCRPTASPSTPLLVSYQEQTGHSQPEEEDEAEEEEAGEPGHTETYADYVPSKSKIGKQHPDRAVETSTLSSVRPQTSPTPWPCPPTVGPCLPCS
ncbi:hypothetical protein P7K49_000601 [Saguinus oedipus]|uniref:Uncharacterized protein n=1 Tax=Saguinus oedipus TaxID=9490 RepID=A0ABQ9WCK3_SAGOE|nr:hypothetical protein P7K49_000601 [Saguinus oedipus]